MRTGIGVTPELRALKSRAAREIYLLVVIGAATFVVSARLDLFEAFAGWAGRHEGVNADELVMVALTGFVVSSIYAWRRHRQLKVRVGELVQTRHALAVTNQRYRSLFDYHPHAVLSLDLEGRFVAVNAACEELSGYSRQELEQMEFADLLPPEVLEETATAFAKVVDRRPQQLESAVVRRDGSVVELDVTGLPIVVGGDVVGVYGIAQDITDRNRVERALMRSQEQAEAANEAKSLFLANVSHEIRTPLTSLLGMTELLQDSDLDEDQRMFVETMDRAGHRLLVLVTDILDFSKIEAGRAELEMVAIDLGAVVGEVAALVRPAAQHKGLRLRCDVEAQLPSRVLGDPARISQVLTNLLDNAVKFTEHGRVQVAVATTGPVRGDTVGVVVSVSDSGIGIGSEQQDTLFEAFSQGDPSITRRYGGTGLGLAICQQLVTLMGGTITVASNPGRGSTFTVTLPMQLASSSRAAG